MPLLFTCCAIAARSAAVDILYGLPDEPSPPEKDAALAVVVGIINTAAAINSSSAIPTEISRFLFFVICTSQCPGMPGKALLSKSFSYIILVYFRFVNNFIRNCARILQILFWRISSIFRTAAIGNSDKLFPGNPFDFCRYRYIILREKPNKTNFARSNDRTHVSYFVTLRLIQRP